MQIEDYFDFLAPDDIRVKGSRIGIESVLYEHIYRAQTPEAIASRLPSLSLEQILATILYYVRNKEKLDAYMADWLIWGQHMREAQDRNPPPVLVHLRKAKAEQGKTVPTA